MMQAPSIGGSFMYDVMLPKAEKISWLLTLLGLLGYWNQLTVGALVLQLGLGTLALVYFLRAFEPTKARNQSLEFGLSAPPQVTAEAEGSFYYDIVLPKVVMFGSAATLIGTLSKLLFWNSRTQLLLVGVGTLLVVILLQALRQQLSRQALLIGALGGLMLYIPFETFVRQFHRNDPVLAEKILFKLHHPRDQAAAEAVRQHQRVAQ